MRQLGLALALYEQDNDGTLPAADLPVAGGVVTWRDRTFPYAKAAGLYSCPEDAAGRSSSTALPSSYGMNTILGRRSATPSHGKPFPLASVLRPSETIVLVDTRGSAGGGWDITDPAFLPEKGRELYAHGPKHTLFTHPSGRINILVADGHVKSLPPSYTLAPVNMWTRDNAPFTGTALRNARAILGHAASE